MYGIQKNATKKFLAEINMWLIITKTHVNNFKQFKEIFMMASLVVEKKKRNSKKTKKKEINKVKKCYYKTLFKFGFPKVG